MINTLRKRLYALPSWAQVVIAIVVVCLIVVLVVAYAPKYGDSDNVTGDQFSVPTVVVTNQIETTTINHAMIYRGVHINVSQAVLASAFSDDHKRAGTYTLRVKIQTKNPNSDPVGVDYVSLTRLALPSGELVKPKLVGLKPMEIPGRAQNGFIDFPLSEKVPLSQLSLHFNDQVIPLAAG